MKEQDKITARELNETMISNMPDRESKVSFIKIQILTGLEKRVENISEIFNTDIKKNQSEMKNTIIEMKNILDGVNNRLEESEE